MRRYISVMEMTFPHHAVSKDSVSNRLDHKAMLAAAIARQANSRTVRAVRRAERDAAAGGDDVANRIHYFAHHHGQKMAVRGAFWRNVAPNPYCEPTVYQADLAYVKVDPLNLEATGEQLNHAGHGTSRTL
jgi:hypothetical protein